MWVAQFQHDLFLAVRVPGLSNFGSPPTEVTSYAGRLTGADLNPGILKPAVATLLNNLSIGFL
jgi:hypothetical protein